MTDMAIQKTPTLGKKAVSGIGRLVSKLFRFAMKLILVISFILGGLFFGGFFQFSSRVIGHKVPVNLEPVHGIVVLTGGSARIVRAFELLEQKKGERLLISGVHHGVTLSAILKNNTINTSFSNCCVDLDSAAKNTAGNATETRKWLEANGYKSLILVTSAYHMPRSLLEFRREMPEIKFVPYPVKLEALHQKDWWKNPETLRFMISEYSQYVGAWVQMYVPSNTLVAWRGSMMGK